MGSIILGIVLAVIAFFAPATVIWLKLRFEEHWLARWTAPLVAMYAVGVVVGQIARPGHEGPAFSVLDLVTQLSAAMSLPLLLFSANLPAVKGPALYCAVAMLLGAIAVVITAIASHLIFYQATGMMSHSESVATSALMTAVFIGGTPNMGALRGALSIDADMFIAVHTAETIAGGFYVLLLVTRFQWLLQRCMRPYSGVRWICCPNRNQASKQVAEEEEEEEEDEAGKPAHHEVAAGEEVGAAAAAPRPAAEAVLSRTKADADGGEPLLAPAEVELAPLGRGQRLGGGEAGADVESQRAATASGAGGEQHEPQAGGSQSPAGEGQSSPVDVAAGRAVPPGETSGDEGSNAGAGETEGEDALQQVAEGEDVHEFGLACSSRANRCGMLGGVALALTILIVSLGLGMLAGEGASAQVTILAITTISLALSFVKRVRGLPHTFTAGQYAILVFVCAVGMLVDVQVVVNSAPVIMLAVACITVVAVSLHVLLALFAGFDSDTTIVASVSNLLSPPFVGMACSALHNKELLVPGITAGLVGYAVGNYMGIGVAYALGGTTD